VDRPGASNYISVWMITAINARYARAVHTARTYGCLFTLAARASTYSNNSVQSPDSSQCLFGKYYALHNVTSWTLRGMARRKKKVALLATTVPFAFCNERNVKNQRHAG